MSVDTAVSVPTGRVTVTGTIVKAELRDSDYGSSLKITVRSDDGWLVWGTAPSPITVPVGGCALLRDTRVSFVATVTAGNRPEFGFYKRPKLATFDGPASALAILNSEGRYPV